MKTLSPVVPGATSRNGVSPQDFMRLEPDGAALVAIDGVHVFLEPDLACLFEILTGHSRVARRGQQSRPAADTLGCWITRGDVLALWNQRSRRWHTSLTLARHLSRLRALLRAQGVNPRLLETHRYFGVRFAWRRPDVTRAQ